jgi:hypothetical protein
MSGDSINTLKMVKQQPLNLSDLDYTTRLIEPFEDIIIERFNLTSSTEPTNSTSQKSKIFIFIVIGLVLIINFPKIREKSGINEYILWLISAALLFGVMY